MNTLVALAIHPLDTGKEGLSSYVAEVIKIIEASGLPHRTTSMHTEIEGDWDVVMQVVKDATMVLTDKGYRTAVSFRADIRPGRTGTMTSKVEKLDSILGGTRG